MMIPQHMEALAQANRIRLPRAALKRDIAQGRRDFRDVLMENPVEARTMTLEDLLLAQHGWGVTRSRRLLRRVGISEHRRVGELTDRQRQVVCLAVESVDRGQAAA